jgi:hypothetical protein
MALIAIAADKGAPGVTTAAIALAAVWPRPVLLAECDPAGGDLIYRLPSASGSRLDPRRGLLSLAISARRGGHPGQVWEHAQKLRGGLDVLVGVANAEQGAGLDLMWDQVGATLSALPEADVIADCGRLGADGRAYDLLARADAVILVTRANLGDLVRLRDRAVAIDAAIRGHGGVTGRIGALVIADHKHFGPALAEVEHVLTGAGSPVSVLGGLAHEPKSAEMLSGEWGGKLDRSLLIRTAREIAAQLVGRLSADPGAVARRSPAGPTPAGLPPAGLPRGAPTVISPPPSGPAPVSQGPAPLTPRTAPVTHSAPVPAVTMPAAPPPPPPPHAPPPGGWERVAREQESWPPSPHEPGLRQQSSPGPVTREQIPRDPAPRDPAPREQISREPGRGRHHAGPGVPAEPRGS